MSLSIFSGLVPFIDSMLASGLTSLLKAIVPALSTSTTLFNTGVYQTWNSVLTISYALSSIFLIAVAYSYFSGRNLSGINLDRRSIATLVFSLVLMPFTLYICQLVLDVNDAITAAVMPYGRLSAYSAMVIGKLGGYGILTLVFLTIVVGLLYLVLVMRVLLLFFTASLMPLMLLCYSIEWTRGLAEKMVSIFAEMAFLPFFIAVALKIGVSVSYSAFTSYQSGQLVIGGTYLLPLIVPFLISPAGSRIMQQLGMPAASAVIMGAGMAGLGAISYASGFVSYPLSSILSHGRVGAVRQAPSQGFFRTLRDPARLYSAGMFHARALGSGVERLSESIQSRLGSSSSRVPRIRRSIRFSENFRPDTVPHKIYAPKDDSDE
ncbi:MAG: hypothetical protein KIY12_03575 [Thermoplasmata archaeon]|uniref:Uncharacterized protein n=1 Tax=Candidatus Sysuiplasma superficiale TaxID=2823368 RepID=A0A8J7YN81_9ARCH|nr:hypothetical protein [Candidatus Sysuiplasma superficiale]MBX8643787.1 hypothetical protein [Candidatus Sysuiplasma superficiale]MCL4346611.1 hypothetical protein [Candidatus Thermoplasmatota archaeon]